MVHLSHTARRVLIGMAFAATMTAAAGALAALLASNAQAAEIADPWPFPPVVSVIGTAPLPCPAGFSKAYAGQRVGVLNWRYRPASPNVLRAPSRVCLDRDGGQPFSADGFALVVGTPETSDCVLCSHGGFDNVR